MPAASMVLAALADREPTLGEGRLLCIEGPAGAGKTTFADRIAALEPAATVVHMDELYDGWSGLPAVEDQLRTVLAPLAHGKPGSYRRYDWHAGRYAETVPVAPGPLLVLEGVGSWAPAFAPLVTVLVWMDAPEHERFARVVSRDGAGVAAPLRRWIRAERKHLARTGARERADIVLGG